MNSATRAAPAPAARGRASDLERAPTRPTTTWVLHPSRAHRVLARRWVCARAARRESDLGRIDWSVWGRLIHESGCKGQLSLGHVQPA